MDGDDGYRERRLSCSESDFSSDSNTATDDEVRSHSRIFRYGDGPSFSNKRSIHNVLGEYK